MGVNHATLRSLAKTGGTTLVAAVMIGLTVAVSQGTSLTSNLVRACAIGVCNWFFVEALARPVVQWRRGRKRRPHPFWGWPYALFAIVAGSFAGFVAGDLVSSWLLGTTTSFSLKRSIADNPMPLYVLLLPSVAVILVLSSIRVIAARNSSAKMARILASEAQLRLFESQLNPHMLFNCLACLQELMESDQQRAHFMFDRLIGFLRANLDGSRLPQHRIKDEFSRLADFLALMQIRMGDRLSFQLSLPEDLCDYEMPSLLLQPLVENAIKHGLEPSVGGGYVHVSAAQEGEQLVLRVRDSGVGLNGAGKPGNGFGLHHVRQRLEVLYGAGASFHLKAAKDGDGGAAAVVRLPLTQPS